MTDAATHPDSGAGGGSTPLVDSSLAAFLQSGLSVVLGTRGPDGRPIAGLGLACIVKPDRSIRVLLREPANVELLNSLRRGEAIAATFTWPRTHRSTQLKSSAARTLPMERSDLHAIVRQLAYFETELQDGGYAEVITRLYCAWREDEVIAIEFIPEAAFEQTPGPGAGNAITR